MKQHSNATEPGARRMQQLAMQGNILAVTPDELPGLMLSPSASLVRLALAGRIKGFDPTAHSSVSQFCKALGVNRMAYYRAQKR